MSIRIIRKALGLLIVDIVIIIGIFVLQFRTDSSIIEKIGNLQLTFTQAEDNNQNLVVQNKFRMSYNGLNLFFDDQTPAIIGTKSGEIKPVKLIGWEKKDNLVYHLSFEEKVQLTIELASEELDASLAVIADIPGTVTTFAMPYNYSSNMKVQQADEKQVILSSKKEIWEISAESLGNGYMAMSRMDSMATFSIYSENQKFTFEDLLNLEIADASVYNTNIKTFKNNLVSAFKSNSSESNLTEQVIVSYIAAQAENGNYVQAIDDIPSNLKKSKQRTYLSAPYLNTLEDMNVTLDKAVSDYEKKITDSANSGNLDLFTVQNISNFMLIHSTPSTVRKLLINAASADISNTSIAQATGILRVYADLVERKSDYAQYLSPVLQNCIERIQDSCTYENNVLTISENDTFLSVIQAVETGIAVMRYGQIVNDQTLVKAGYVLVNSYLKDTSYDLRTLSNLYPIIAYDNSYYPHIEKINTKDSNEVWAWTCSDSITYEKDSEGTITLSIDFPEGLTHYVIFKGIPQFSSIYIYNMAFRTDPRFETYNSSGYVYKTTNGSLLLKSRHKSQIETIRLEYHEKPVEKTVEKPAAAAETKESSVTTETAVETKKEEVSVENKTASESTTTVETPAEVVVNEEKTETAGTVETPAAETESAEADTGSKKKKTTWGKKTN